MDRSLASVGGGCRRSLIPSGIPEVVRQGETGLLVSDDPEQTAAALRSLAEDPAL